MEISLNRRYADIRLRTGDCRKYACVGPDALGVSVYIP